MPIVCSPTMTSNIITINLLRPRNKLPLTGRGRHKVSTEWDWLHTRNAFGENNIWVRCGEAQVFFFPGCEMCLISIGESLKRKPNCQVSSFRLLFQGESGGQASRVKRACFVEAPMCMKIQGGDQLAVPFHVVINRIRWKWIGFHLY